MARCFVFPGQGSQAIGMGRALADAFPLARETFEEVDDALGQKLSKIMFDGPAEELGLTVNTQPALMAHSVAMFRVLQKEAAVDLDNVRFLAGHSLGEYSALCAGGAISLPETARLLRTRGEAMQAAAPLGSGAMAALIGADIAAAEAAILATDAKLGVCEIANDNAPGQVVISGDKARVEAVADAAKGHGFKMAKLLQVSAPFHSSLMAPAAEIMQAALEATRILALQAPLVANVSAQETDSADDIRALLVKQVTGRVRWTESVEFMAKNGGDKFVEVGSGKVLAGLIKRIAKDAAVISVGEPGDIDSFLKF
jgi:[acyl-carrier-protein] S-malonyltransferase